MSTKPLPVEFVAIGVQIASFKCSLNSSTNDGAVVPLVTAMPKPFVIFRGAIDSDVLANGGTAVATRGGTAAFVEAFVNVNRANALVATPELFVTTTL